VAGKSRKQADAVGSGSYCPSVARALILLLNSSRAARRDSERAAVPPTLHRRLESWETEYAKRTWNS
jgi:hypothetical protein